MKKIYIASALSIVCASSSFAQLEIDLGKKTTTEEFIDFEKVKPVLLIKNMALDISYRYSMELKVKRVDMPPFDPSALMDASACNIDDKTKILNDDLIPKLTLAKEESQVAEIVTKMRQEVLNLQKTDANKYKACINRAEELINKTNSSHYFLFDLEPNQTITVVVKRIFKDKDSKADTISWTKVFRTEEESRWLIHYGLTYAPYIFSRTSNYYAFADTSAANKYTIKKLIEHGPKPWDNISATINFTYPFHPKVRAFDIGFTGGFGLSAGFELSGHAGFSAIIGRNIIIGTGLAMLQRYKLKGEYTEGQIIKTNLDFESLHRKAWMPEVFFTIGYRFANNPFSKKAESSKEEKNAD